jgi:hypothetical protein
MFNSLTIRAMPIKPTMRSHYTPITLLKLKKKVTILHVDQGMEKLNHIYMVICSQQMISIEEVIAYTYKFQSVSCSFL